ncbi:MAG TPA: ornithine carbamoyltransferase [Chloroflexota bacterium]|nr:ornithine carbamoyltransferase [Chloroflexota bacterium]
MRHKDLLAVSDLDSSELRHLLASAAALKRAQAARQPHALLPGRILALLFQKPSLRTRVSFEAGMLQLGGAALYLSPQEVGLGERESVADVARVISRYVDAVVARTFLHDDVVAFAEAASVPVVNGLSDLLHPCQCLADLLTIQERLGGLDGVTLAYVGDGNNVANSLVEAAPRVGMHLRVATPRGYEPDAGIWAEAARLAAANRTELVQLTDPRAAVDGADAIYTDTWYSMGQEAERELRQDVFPPYQVNARLLAAARPGALVLHCLPAHRGQEITDDVLDGPQSRVLDQAENRLHAQKALLCALLGADVGVAALAAEREA